MKKVISWVLTIALLFSLVPADTFTLTAEAATVASGKCGTNLTWTLDDAGTLTISGTGDMTEFPYTGAPWKSYCTSIKTVTIGSKVTSIGSYAFDGCTGLTSVTIPDSVASIGYSAFYNCTELTHITIPEGVTAIDAGTFAYCSSLTSITIPNSVTSIGGNAFYNCSKLTSIVIPDGVVDIPVYTFYGCSSLSSIAIPSSLTSVGFSAFGGCYRLTNVTYCGTTEQWNAITMESSNGNLTNATRKFHNYENGVCTICRDGETNNFLTFTLNDAEDGYIVSGCDEAATGKLEIPATYKGLPVTAIGDSAFHSCVGLTSVIIPNSVTNIGWYAFRNCTGLTSVTIPDSVTRIGIYAFASCTGLASVTIPNSITRIEPYAFFKCTNLTSVTIPDSVTSIDYYAFCYCEHLTSVTIPDSVTSIGQNAFDFCTSLTSVTIPDSVTRIDYFAFRNCTDLKKIYFEGSAPTIVFDAFNLVVATAYYYPDATWTEEVLQNYGGTITWVAMEAEQDYSVGLDYEISDDETYYIVTGIGDCQDTKVIIPATHEGLPVKEIKNDAFGFDSGAMTSVVIPDSVTRIGDGAFGGCYDLEEVVIGNGVTSIGAYAFVECTGLTSIEIPDSVISIGDNAFGSCTGLTEVTIGKSVSQIGSSVFSGCVALEQIVVDEENTSYCSDTYGVLYNSDKTSLICCPAAMTGTYTIPSTVTSIEAWAFGYCDELTAMEIPASVTSIGVDAFAYCINLSEITFQGSAPAFADTDWNAGIFYKVNATAYYYPDETWTEDVRQDYGGDITWVAMEKEPEIIASGTCGDNLTWTLDEEGTLTISGTGNMYNFPIDSSPAPWTTQRNSIKNIMIEDGVTSIGHYAFYDCTNLTSVTLGNSIETIGVSAFWDCTSLTSVAIPDSVHTIKGYAFDGCSSLTSVTIGNSVQTIGEDAFDGCSSLTDVYYTGTLKGWCEIFFFNFDSPSTTPMCYAENLYINGELLSGDITIPDGVTAIGCYAFYNCSSLTSVTIPDSVRWIGVYAFDGCSGLTSVTIPDSVTSIANSTFGDCSSLTSITFDGNAPTFGSDAFSNVTATVYYPTGDVTWTEDVRQNYGGTITWVALEQEHTCKYTATVTEPTCTQQGYTTYTCSGCGDSYIDDYTDALGHDHQRTSTTEPTCTEDGFEIYTCSRCGDTKEETLPAGGHHYGDDDVCDDCGHTASGGVPGNALQLPGEEFAGQDTVWIEGVPYPVLGEGENRYIVLPEAEEFLMVTYTYHEGDGQDVHTQYPTGMKVYQVKDGKITYIPELENLLQYSGSSIRITGKKGIRMITSIEKDKKTALTGKGLAGYTLVEYGTVLCFASEIPEGDGLVLGRSYARSNYAYKKGVADPVFATTKDLIQYTNVLVGFSLDQCKDDIAMRPYIILKNAQGEEVTLYGGTIYRSIGYIAYQNRNVFQPKTASYNYVWEIIHHVYGDKYDADYKG